MQGMLEIEVEVLHLFLIMLSSASHKLSDVDTTCMYCLCFHVPAKPLLVMLGTNHMSTWQRFTLVLQIMESNVNKTKFIWIKITVENKLRDMPSTIVGLYDSKFLIHSQCVLVMQIRMPCLGFKVFCDVFLPLCVNYHGCHSWMTFTINLKWQCTWASRAETCGSST